jgi:uncharacterized protein YjbI with pentapeptide repeats
MANDEHVHQLLAGADNWNVWRRTNPHPDLSGANLGRADLRARNLNGVNLSHATLTKANLTGADLIGANLEKAALTEAVLTTANLTEANLNDAHLGGALLDGAILEKSILPTADLRLANLSRATLTDANLTRATLIEANLTGANLTRTNLTGANLSRADLRHAELGGAHLTGADLRGANVTGVNLSRADLIGATLIGANLTNANLTRANLSGANLVEANLSGADLTGCRVYGVSAWKLKLDGVKQQNLVITPHNEPEITVDDIEVAQFIYLMLHNEKIRNVIDTITSKAVLILGRFTDERKAVLNALRDELRKLNYLPILFDFEVPAGGNITETVTLLARMARFIIADLTDPSSIPQELQAIVPHLAKPVQPLLEGASRPYAMFEDYRMYDWVLPIYRYEGLEPLLATLKEKVIDPAEGKVKDLRRRMMEKELTKL